MPTRTLGPGSFTVGADTTQWAGELSQAALTASVDAGDVVPLLDGSNESDEDTIGWTFDGTCLDNFDRDALQDYAQDNAGQIVPFDWIPSSATGKSYDGTLKIAPISIGGTVKSKNTHDFSWNIIDGPHRTDGSGSTTPAASGSSSTSTSASDTSSTSTSESISDSSSTSDSATA